MSTWLLGLAQAHGAPDRIVANEIACAKSPGMTAADCRKAFAVARLAYERATRSYPSRSACYQAFGPCSLWPPSHSVTGTSRFRPQWMGVLLAGMGDGRTARPVVAPGKVRLPIEARLLSDMRPAPAILPTPPVSPPIAGGARPPEALCDVIATSAAKAHLPAGFLARLLWQESSFRTHVVSRAGARGIAQFMPETAAERGLTDAFDAPRAIETSAALLGDLARRFGNLGLAAAAYNGGPARLSGWLKGERALAAETEAYVRAITGRTVQDWASLTRSATPDLPAGADLIPCSATAP